jgi:hypothetical protein
MVYIHPPPKKKKRYVTVLRITECGLIWSWSLYRGNQVKNEVIKVGPTPRRPVSLQKEGLGHRGEQREDGVKTQKKLAI